MLGFVLCDGVMVALKGLEVVACVLVGFDTVGLGMAWGLDAVV